MNQNAQELFCSVARLMPSTPQRESFKAQMKLFLEADGAAKPEHTQVKSPSALSRFLNEYNWNVRSLIRTVRSRVEKVLVQHLAHQRGCKPFLQAIIDLTTLEKTGKFTELPIHVLDGKKGLHLVVLYLVIGSFRVPWAWRVWRGEGSPSPSELALKLLKSLPKWLSRRFHIRVLGDGGFGSDEFLSGIVKLGFEGIVGMRCDRKLANGGQLQDLKTKGQRVVLKGLKIPLWASWCWLKKADGTQELRYVVATFRGSGQSLIRWGRRRWAIEGFFKTIKHRFSLHRFGQRTPRGVYRFLVLAFFAFILTHWHGMATGQTLLPDWGLLAEQISLILLPDIIFVELSTRQKRLKPFLDAYNAA